ncbi:MULTISPECIES: helix-turn-helix domain-containing protein [unclassified Streptomyces]|uniref:helix-turn-helix domain-containing protein n=1 Tax=unclassified Streptomyces TaxID=2593676 RepID=UPI0011612C0C|nr:GAF domain-containing protein [Streptomyces sp. TSRI0107]
MEDRRPTTSSGDPWLDMLTDGWTSVEIEDYRRLRLTESPAHEHQAIEVQALRTLALRERLAEQQRHADELRVLNGLARRLASLRASSEVLQEVAVQARRLLGVDVSYIMLTEADGTLRIDVADGSMGSSLRGIRLPSQSGLGGEVVRTGRPVWSEAYLDDTCFPHTPSSDAAAADERLGGILGVPLIAGEETIGVLFAADRRSRLFVAREVELLAALASHAAVAITNARLFEQYRATARDLQTAYEHLTHTDNVRQRAIELREELTGVIIHGGGFKEIAAALESALGTPVAVFDHLDKRLAGSPVGVPGGPGGVRELVGLAGDPAPRRLRDEHGERVMVPVLLRSGYAGCLVAASPTPIDDEAVHLLTIGATSVALVVMSERSLAEAERRNRGEVINALLSSDIDEATTRRRARSAGIDMERITAVAVLDPAPDDSHGAVQWGQRLVSELGGWSAEYSDHVVALIAGASPVEVRDRLTSLAAGTELPCTVGVASCSGGSRAARDSHEKARQTATVLNALGRPGTCAQASELGVYRGLFNQAGRDEIAAFVRLTIGPLLEHDRRRRRTLAHTLGVYLDQSRHHARTCGELHIHANTLYQRLEKITELIGPRWKDPSHSLEIQLALRMQRLLDTLAPRHD